MTIASPVPEASTKPEESLVFTSKSEKVRTIAAWIPASKQILDDFTELQGYIVTSLPYYVDLAEELQILAGDGVGEDMNGSIPPSAAFNTGLLSATHGWNRLDHFANHDREGNSSDAHRAAPHGLVEHPADER